MPAQSADVARSPVSVCAAICTRDRPRLLGRALRSLTTQSIAPAAIIVIDNAPSSDASMSLVREEFPGVQYFREPVEGLDFARNRALREADSDVVAFMDDDVVVSAEWVAATRAAFSRHDQVVVCTGRVDALSQETEGQRLFEANAGFSCGGELIHFSADARYPRNGLQRPMIAMSISMGAGCSLAVRRSIALGLGGFDEALDLGSALPGGGDHDMIWRALKAGYEVVYDPAVHAWHDHRKELDAAVDQILGHNRATVAMLTKSFATTRGVPRIVVLIYLVWRLVKPGVRLVRRILRQDPLPPGVLLRLWWACWRGLVAYPAARQLAMRRASKLA